VERVTGLGGVFFAARDAAALQRWYAERLGVGGPPETYDDADWHQEAGPTVFAAFGPEHHTSPHLGPRGFGVNFRVRDLDAMVGQLRAAGVDVEVDPQAWPNGRFASLHDPEGNPVQLWEPAP
jgi:glyoxylase I family protein